MKFLLYSDIHLEFGGVPAKFLPDKDSYDAVLLAGDIGTGLQGIAWAGQNFDKPVFYVAGNHEFYHQDITETYERLQAPIQTRLHVNFLQDRVAYLDGYRFIGATLWTDFKLDKDQTMGMWIGRRGMNDYRLIDDGEYRLTPENVLERHKVSMKFIETELQKPFDGKTIVITHHAPSGKSINLKYAGSDYNHLYSSDLDAFIEAYQPDLWVHGHVHTSYKYTIGKTVVAANPRGYVGHGRGPGGCENTDWNPQFILEV